MRFLFVASIVSLVVAGATFACSSSDPVAPGGDAGKDAKAAPVLEDDDDETTDPVVTDDAGDTADASDGATTTPGGDLIKSGDGGISCDDDSFREAETNNDEATANKLAVVIGNTKICGQATAADPDFITFQMPAGATSWFLAPTGQVNISGTIDGQPFTGTNFSSVNNVGEGATWVVQVKATSDTARAWRLRFHFCTDPGDCNN